VLPQGHHCATPPWCEHVPLLLSLWESVPSLQIAVAFAGDPSGLSTHALLHSGALHALINAL
jgi:membrane associated rhomboid family serine protease